MNTTGSPPKALSGFLPEELFSLNTLDKPFRAKQIFKWIADGSRDFPSMTNLPLPLRNALSANYRVFSTTVAQTLRDPDGTVKLQIQLDDNSAVETVLLTDMKGRKTACVSCQVGCPMGCAFCQTGHIGYSRNLDVSEIVEQFYHLEDAVGKLDNIVFMGMGEPLLNLEAIQRTVEILTHPDGRALSRRRITVSTSGLCEGIYRLADQGPNVRLAVSLTTADPVLRERLMPVTRSNSLSELRKAIAYYIEKTGNRVTLEAAIMQDVNTKVEHARQLADFARDLHVHINLIPWNPVPGLPFSTPSTAEVHRFAHMLEREGLTVTLRMRRGDKIGGACGQLGRKS